LQRTPARGRSTHRSTSRSLARIAARRRSAIFIGIASPTNRRVDLKRGELTGGNTPLLYKRARTSRQYDRVRQEAESEPLTCRDISAASLSSRRRFRFVSRLAKGLAPAAITRQCKLQGTNVSDGRDHDHGSRIRPPNAPSRSRTILTSVTPSHFRSRQIPPVV
jgi:hypothetical protein